MSTPDTNFPVVMCSDAEPLMGEWEAPPVLVIHDDGTYEYMGNIKVFTPKHHNFSPQTVWVRLPPQMGGIDLEVPINMPTRTCLGGDMVNLELNICDSRMSTR